MNSIKPLTYFLLSPKRKFILSFILVLFFKVPTAKLDHSFQSSLGICSTPLDHERTLEAWSQVTWQCECCHCDWGEKLEPPEVTHHQLWPEQEAISDPLFHSVFDGHTEK
jgi:hypothetical protein